jgi:hypothetical protein
MTTDDNAEIILRAKKELIKNILSIIKPKYIKNCPYAKKLGLKHSLMFEKSQDNRSRDIAIFLSSG